MQARQQQEQLRGQFRIIGWMGSVGPRPRMHDRPKQVVGGLELAVFLEVAARVHRLCRKLSSAVLAVGVSVEFADMSSEFVCGLRSLVHAFSLALRYWRCKSRETSFAQMS